MFFSKTKDFSTLLSGPNRLALGKCGSLGAEGELSWDQKGELPIFNDPHRFWAIVSGFTQTLRVWTFFALLKAHSSSGCHHHYGRREDRKAQEKDL